MSDHERQILGKIPAMISVGDLRRLMVNSRDKAPAVYRAAFQRLIDVSASEYDDPIARACWTMVHTIEQIRQQAGRKVWRMNRLRPKIEREGERAALEYCALHQTDGFQEVLDYGLPQFTAEAIVLSFPKVFTNEGTRRAATARLIAAGIDVDRLDPI